MMTEMVTMMALVIRETGTGMIGMTESSRTVEGF